MSNIAYDSVQLNDEIVQQLDNLNKGDIGSTCMTKYC